MLKICVEKKASFLIPAAETFAEMWQKVTGRELEIITEDDNKSDLVVMGSDAVSLFTHEKVLAKLLPELKTRVGTDDFEILSAKENGRNFLFLAGGNLRAYFYAVYHFFEKAASCRYFWDMDVIPEKEDISIENFSLYESPRFSYRGIRYFAHRGLHRFQAEHWEWEDWKKEIDYLLKKRFNLFMLRIGLDDLFQKAFPQWVPYRDDFIFEGGKERSYDDHTLFMPLQERAALRRKILSYAFERGLIHPEDIGTMTHWYSRTPMDFIRNAKPGYLPRASGDYYSDPTGQVWDIRNEKELDYYFALTEAHIKEYGKATGPELFHTIGLAERHCFDDEEASHKMKLYTYRCFTQKLREKYPSAPLMLAAWEFLDWKPQQVKELLSSLDPEHTLVLDYTADIQDENNFFVTWDIPGKFPYIFGIFHSNENNSEIRGNYPLIEERLSLAAKDPMCKGMVLWPETSHADTLMLEYVASNSWKPEHISIDSFLKKFCEERYISDGTETEKSMREIWQKFLPSVKNRIRYAFRHPKGMVPVYYIRILEICALNKQGLFRKGANMLEKFAEALKEFPELFRLLASLSEKELSTHIKRDMLDIAKSAFATLLDCFMAKIFTLLKDFEEGNEKEKTAALLRENLDHLRKCNLLLADSLSSSKEFSLYDSLLKMTEKEGRNKNFEYTLKGNAENSYSRSYIPEILKYCVEPELELFAEHIEQGIADNISEWEFPPEFRNKREEVKDRFYEKPLKEMAPDQEKAEKELSGNLRKAALLAEKLCSTIIK